MKVIFQASLFFIYVILISSCSKERNHDTIDLFIQEFNHEDLIKGIKGSNYYVQLRQEWWNETYYIVSYFPYQNEKSSPSYSVIYDKITRNISWNRNEGIVAPDSLFRSDIEYLILYVRKYKVFYFAMDSCNNTFISPIQTERPYLLRLGGDSNERNGDTIMNGWHYSSYKDRWYIRRSYR